MLKPFLAASVLTAASVFAVSPVHALSSYSFSFAGSSISGNGIFTTTDLPNGATAGTSVTINDISGSITDVNNGNIPKNISALLAPGTFAGNNNLLFPLAADPNQLNANGVSFTLSDSSRYNLFRFGAGSYGVSSLGFGALFPTLNLTNVTPVPFEFSPALGLGVLGGLFATKKLIQNYAKK